MSAASKPFPTARGAEHGRERLRHHRRRHWRTHNHKDDRHSPYAAARSDRRPVPICQRIPLRHLRMAQRRRRANGSRTRLRRGRADASPLCRPKPARMRGQAGPMNLSRQFNPNDRCRILSAPGRCAPIRASASRHIALRVRLQRAHRMRVSLNRPYPGGHRTASARRCWIKHALHRARRGPRWSQSK